MTSLAEINGPVIIFDGHCALCHAAVRYLIKHDTRALIKFQTPEGLVALNPALEVPSNAGSVMLILNGRLYMASEAAIRAWMFLGHSRWKSLLLRIPVFIRDGIYNLIARNRYKWFGQLPDCPLLPPHRYFL